MSDLNALSLAAARDKLIAKEITSVELTEACLIACLLYTSPSPRDTDLSRMPSSA